MSMMSGAAKSRRCPRGTMVAVRSAGAMGPMRLENFSRACHLLGRTRNISSVVDADVARATELAGSDHKPIFFSRFTGIRAVRS
jgi:hypothetical protein